MSNEVLTVRLTSDQKACLERLADERGTSVSDVIRELIGDAALIQDALRAILKEKAQELGIPLSDLYERVFKIMVFLFKSKILDRSTGLWDTSTGERMKLGEGMKPL